MKLDGKRAIVTGSSQGLGLEIAKAYAREGASVILCSRTESDIEKAKKEVESVCVSGEQRIIGLSADVSEMADVTRLAATAEHYFGGLDILVCNAGIYGPKGALETSDWQAWVHAVKVNLFGTVLPCKLLLPLLRRSHGGKIIILSGGGATKPLPYLSSYATSKAAVVRFGETLALEVAQDMIDVNMVAPGALNTRLLDEILNAGPGVVGAEFFEASRKQKDSGGTPPEKGASLCVFLASSLSNGISGRLISAVWDPWEQFTESNSIISGTDVYTLRRIVPEDRGFSWK